MLKASCTKMWWQTFAYHRLQIPGSSNPRASSADGDHERLANPSAANSAARRRAILRGTSRFGESEYERKNGSCNSQRRDAKQRYPPLPGSDRIVDDDDLQKPSTDHQSKLTNAVANHMPEPASSSKVNDRHRINSNSENKDAVVPRSNLSTISNSEKPFAGQTNQAGPWGRRQRIAP